MCVLFFFNFYIIFSYTNSLLVYVERSQRILITKFFQFFNINARVYIYSLTAVTR